MQLTPALVLLARAARSPRHARAISSLLSTDRIPVDREDRLTLALFRDLTPWLLTHAGDVVALRHSVRQALGFDRAFTVELALLIEDDVLVRAEPTRELIAQINAGLTASWELPAVPVPARPRPSAWRHAMPGAA